MGGIGFKMTAVPEIIQRFRSEAEGEESYDKMESQGLEIEKISMTHKI